jgi:dephospho-CoA kinase
MPEKVVIGLTGNIAVGKSLVLRMLQELGATVIDADKLVHQLMRQGGPAYQAIVEEFGRFIIDESGQIDRKKLGRIVFSIPEALTQLESITHPAVRQEILQRIDAATTPAVVVEAIKLFESGLADQCQSNWVVTAPPEIQLKRLVERRKMMPETAQQRIRAQTPQPEKVAQANVIIDNSGDLAKTWSLVKKQYTNLMEKQAGPIPSNAPESTPAAATPDPAGIAPNAPVTADNISVRRAKRGDLQAMAKLIEVGTKGAIDPDLSQMMEALFSRAYLIATVDDYVVGIAGWLTENLIAGLQDFFVLRDDMWSTVGQKMLDKIHEEIDSLSCEVSLCFVFKEAGLKPIEFFESQGYERTESQDLGYMWTDAALEWQPENSLLLYKKLREQRIMVPM